MEPLLRQLASISRRKVARTDVHIYSVLYGSSGGRNTCSSRGSETRADNLIMVIAEHSTGVTKGTVQQLSYSVA